MNPVLLRLKTLHSRLDQELGRELKRRLPDHGRVKRLKKLKLAVKDRLQGLVPRPVRAG